MAFDRAAFRARWNEVVNNDPEYKQHEKEESRQREERRRLATELAKLQEKLSKAKDEEERKVISQEMEITETNRQLANSRFWKALYQANQRSYELEKQVLTTDFPHAPASELEGAEGDISEWKEEVKFWESQENEQERKLTQLQKEEELLTLSKRSQQFLNEALKAGYMKVMSLVCLILGLPGVGKTLIKHLLLDKLPPLLRSSTICAEAPVRIEIRTVSGTRIRNEQGNWKEVDDDGMLDVVANMILSVEPEQTKPLGEKPSTEAGGNLSQKPRKREGVFTRIVNWITKRNEKEEATKKAPSQEKKPVAVVSVQTASPVSLEACQKAMKKIMDKLVQRINKLRSGKRSSNPLSCLPVSVWVYFTDSGGQPQYHELLPLFVGNISSALCVTRLTDKLDEIQMVEYFQDGEKVGASQHSQFSAKDTIRCLVNTIQSYSTQEKPPKIIMIGTHLDVLERQLQQLSSEAASSTDALTSTQSTSNDIETLEEKDKKLLEMLEPEFSSQLVYFSNDMKKLLFPVNALNPGEHETNVAQSIRDSVETSGGKEVKVPIWWYVLELLLQELARELGRGVLSRAECLEMARLLNIEEDSFDAALEFLNKLNVIKYTPGVLPDVVFVDSQIPLSKVSELVHRSYKLRQPTTSECSSTISPVEGTWKQFRDQGVVSEECLKEFPKHYVYGIFNKEHLCELLTSLLVFAEIPPPVKVLRAKPQKYFVMPALLETLLEAALERHRVSSPSIAPLLVRFPDHSRRAGVFCCFVVHLIRYYGWKLLLDSKEPLYRNCIKLQFLTSPPSTITVIDSNSYIEVHVDITAHGSSSEYASTTTIIRQAILNGIHAACVALKYKETVPQLSFLCPHTGHPKETQRHTTTLTPDRKYWRCDLTPKVAGSLKDHHQIWFKKADSRSTVASTTSRERDEPPAKLDSRLPHIAEYVTIKTGSATTSQHEAAASRDSTACLGATKTVLSSQPESLGPLPSTGPLVATRHSTSPSPGLDVSASSLTTATPPANTLVVPYESCVQLKYVNLIRWTDERGETQRFYLMDNVSSHWRDIGELIGLSVSNLKNIATEHQNKPLECCRAVLCHWLENPPREYPTTWRGLFELLKDSRLGQIVSELKIVLSKSDL